VHELVITETGHVDARFKHEVWNYLVFYTKEPIQVLRIQSICIRHCTVKVIILQR